MCPHCLLDGVIHIPLIFFCSCFQNDTVTGGQAQPTTACQNDELLQNPRDIHFALAFAIWLGKDPSSQDLFLPVIQRFKHRVAQIGVEVSSNNSPG